jgi:hypothetical protein
MEEHKSNNCKHLGEDECTHKNDPAMYVIQGGSTMSGQELRKKHDYEAIEAVCQACTDGFEPK